MTKNETCNWCIIITYSLSTGQKLQFSFFILIFSGDLELHVYGLHFLFSAKCKQAQLCTSCPRSPAAHPEHLAAAEDNHTSFFGDGAFQEKLLNLNSMIRSLEEAWTKTHEECFPQIMWRCSTSHCCSTAPQSSLCSFVLINKRNI